MLGFSRNKKSVDSKTYTHEWGNDELRITDRIIVERRVYCRTGIGKDQYYPINFVTNSNGISIPSPNLQLTR